MDSNDTSYRVDPLIVAEPVPAKVLERFKGLRLEALHTTPHSYLSTLEQEEKLTNSEWEAMMLKPAHQYLICHRPASPIKSSAADFDYASGEWAENDVWVGMFCLCGPYDKDEYAVTSLPGSTATDFGEHEAGWYINAVYLQPELENQEGHTVIQEAIFDHLRFWTDKHLPTMFDDATGLEKPKRARLAGILPIDAEILGSLYESMAGQTVGWADRPLGRKIGGLEDLADVGSVGGLRMRCVEKVIVC
ncbi:MAG: hypothetical protein Q9205_004623 [Flavoplaca limonia]